MSSRQKIIIGVIGLAVIIGLVLVFIFGGNSGQPSEELLEQPLGEASVVVDAETNMVILPDGTSVSTADIKKESTPEIETTRLASTFAERFGTYSNQSDFANIQDLKLFMTKEMKKWADNYIAKQKAEQKDNSVYYGITTRSLNTKLEELAEDSARTVVNTQRREVGGYAGEPKIFYQDLIIKFKKQGDNWLVDSATWQ